MNLWIDLDNSPHVHFFVPIIHCLRQRGVEPLITVRSFGQTEELARWYGLRFVTIGEHHTPRHTVTRVTATLKRAIQLASFMRDYRPMAAVSHGSRAMLVAAWVLGIPAVTLYDYEFVSSRIFFSLSRRVLAPSAIPLDRLRELGLDERKFVQYPGFKEEVYVYTFPTDPQIITQLGLDPSRLIVTLRPPATWSHYHDHKSEILFEALIDRLHREGDVQVIVLPRTDEQADDLASRWRLGGGRFRVLRHAVDGLSLISQSDAVFSGGGTMVREAALMGVNAYSVFAGKTGAVDEALARSGKLKILKEVSDVNQVPLHKRRNNEKCVRGRHETLDFVVSQILAAIHPG